MSRPLFQNSVARTPTGAVLRRGRFSLDLLTKPATDAGEYVSSTPTYTFSTNSSGQFPASLAIPTPTTGAWQWRLTLPDGAYLDAYVEQGDGSSLEFDEFVTLAGLTGTAAGTPQNEFLTQLYTAAGTADNVATLADLSTLAAKDLTVVPISAAYTLTPADSGKVFECNGTFAVTLPNGISGNMQATIVNVGIGAITLAAETTLQSKDGAVILANQFGAATVYHRGSDIWFASGDLS